MATKKETHISPRLKIKLVPNLPHDLLTFIRCHSSRIERIMFFMVLDSFPFLGVKNGESEFNQSVLI